MKIKIEVDCSSASATYVKGQVRDVTDEVGEDLIRAGFAKKLTREKSVEKAVKRK